MQKWAIPPRRRRRTQRAKPSISRSRSRRGASPASAKTGPTSTPRVVPPGESFTVADLQGAGRIAHTWFTLSCIDPDYLKNIRIQMFWDGASTPRRGRPRSATSTPLGHGRVAKVNSAFVTVLARPELNTNLPNPNVAGFNTYFPMPFSSGAKIVIQNGSAQEIRALYYQIDYQEWGPRAQLATLPCRIQRVAAARSDPGRRRFRPAQPRRRGQPPRAGAAGRRGRSSAWS